MRLAREESLSLDSLKDRRAWAFVHAGVCVCRYGSIFK